MDENVNSIITNGDVIIDTFDVEEVHLFAQTVFVVLSDKTELEFKRDWFEAPYQSRK